MHKLSLSLIAHALNLINLTAAAMQQIDVVDRLPTSICCLFTGSKFGAVLDMVTDRYVYSLTPSDRSISPLDLPANWVY